METSSKKIVDLIKENVVYASVLYHFGIEFYEYSEKTLAQICKEKNLNIKRIINKLESPAYNQKEIRKCLCSYPVDLVIEYLKHTHFVFIKRKLPFALKLIQNIDVIHPQYPQMIEDLRLAFPMFVEDFIHHIYDEEDTLFSYILLLKQSLSKLHNPSELYYKMEAHAIQHYAIEHEAHDDEMAGIREITQNYNLSDNTPLAIKVLFSELQSFEKELIMHAGIENEILFPKALALEKKVKEIFREKISLN